MAEVASEVKMNQVGAARVRAECTSYYRAKARSEGLNIVETVDSEPDYILLTYWKAAK